MKRNVEFVLFQQPRWLSRVAVEGVFATIEIKATLNKSKLKEGIKSAQ